MRLQQLKLYETLLGGSAERARQLLSHQPFLRPLLDLLNQFAAAKTESKCPSRMFYSKMTEIISKFIFVFINFTLQLFLYFRYEF